MGQNDPYCRQRYFFGFGSGGLNETAWPIRTKFDKLKQRNIFLILVSLNVTYLKIQYGGRPLCWISKNCYYFETAWPIFAKLDTQKSFTGKNFTVYTEL
jgi:hypothetical protein